MIFRVASVLGRRDDEISQKGEFRRVDMRKETGVELRQGAASYLECYRRFFACTPGRMMAETGAGRSAWRPKCHTVDGDGKVYGWQLLVGLGASMVRDGTADRMNRDGHSSFWWRPNVGTVLLAHSFTAQSIIPGSMILASPNDTGRLDLEND